MFGRRRPQPEPQQDEALPFLGVDQAQRLRALVRTAFAERGLEVTLHPDHVADADGRVFGLWNVAAACHNDEAGESAWAQVVGDHVTRTLAGMDGPPPFEGLTPEDVARRTFARLYDAEHAQGMGGVPHVEFAPGIVQVLALDLPETVVPYPEEAVAEHGGWAALQAHGLRNLGEEPADQVQRLDAPEGGSFWVVLGDSVHTGSKALLMPELAAPYDRQPGEHGWLLSVPNRHQLCWHVIRGPEVIPTVQAMVRFTTLGWSDAPGPVSPHLYWWDGSAYRQLTRLDEQGRMSIHVDEAFQAVLERLVAG